MNGATEATLAELLAVAQAMNANLVTLQRLANQGGGGSTPSGGAASGLSAVSAAAGPARLALGALSVASNMISSLFGAMGNIIGKVVTGLVSTAGNLFNFAKQAAAGTAKLSDFYDAFRDLPFLVGTVASIFADIIRYSERLLTTYQDLTKYGASFSGDLFKMAQAATRGFMSLDEFSKVIKTNSDILSTLGGDVDKGMNKFVDIQNKLLGPGSQYSKSLLGLGYTASDTADMLSAVINQQGNLNKKELANNDMVAASVANIAKEMDLYSKVTGKSREELEKELKKKSFDAAWKQFTSEMGPEQAASAALAVEKALATGGQGAADALRQMFMTGGEISTPITDASKQFYVQTNGAAENYVRTMYESALNLKTGSREQLETQIRAGRDIGRAYADFIGPMGKTAGLFSVMNNNYVNNAALMTSNMKFSKLTNDEITKMALEAAKKQKDAAVGSAANLSQAEINIKNFGVMIMNLVNMFVGPIAGKLSEFGSNITDALLPVMKNITIWFTTAFNELKSSYTEGGFVGLIKKFGQKLMEGATNVWTFIKPIWLEHIQPALENAFKSIMDFLQPYFKAAMDQVSDMLNAWVYQLPGGKRIFGAEDPEVRAKRRRYETLIAEDDAKINQLKELIEANKAAMGDSRRTDVAPYQAKIDELQRQLIDAENKRRVDGTLKPRHSGTIGMTGSWWEKEDATLNVQKGESVITQPQMGQIVDTAGQKGYAEAVQRLNTTQIAMVALLKQLVDSSERNVAATKDLNGNIWAA